MHWLLTRRLERKDGAAGRGAAPSTGMCEPKPASWFSSKRGGLDSKSFNGEVAERLNALVLKTSKG